MAIIGIFEDEFGLIPADPGRMIFINNIPPAPPLPAIPSGVFQPPSSQIYLSLITPVYTNLVTYSSGASIAVTITFLGYTMSVTYAFTCAGTTNVVTLPSLFDKEIISWYDKDKSVKSTPEDPGLLKIPLPLLVGNHQDNPHLDGDDIIIKLENGAVYVIRGAVCALQSEIEKADEAITKIFEDGAQCYYVTGDVDGYNNK